MVEHEGVGSSVASRRRSGIGLPSDALVASVSLGALGVLLLAVLVVDVLDVAGSRSLVGSNSGITLWQYLFREGSPVEWVQALTLLVLVFYAGVGAGGQLRDVDAQRLLLFLAAGVALMIVEDTGNVSQTLAQWASAFSDVSPVVFRGPIFALIGLIMVYGPVRYRAVLMRDGRALRLFVIGYAFYGLMVLGEVLNQLFPFYVRVGTWVREVIFGGRFVPATFPGAANEELGLTGTEVDAFFLMDYLYEETLELVGATFLLLGVLQLLRSRDTGSGMSPT